MIADIVAYLFCNDVALVSVCYSYLGFTFTSSPGTGKPGKAQQTHTIDTLRYNIIMEFTFQTNHPESGMTTLLFHVMLRWPANVFFWGANPLNFTEGYWRPPSHPPSNPPPWASTVEAHPRVGGAVWPESSHGTLAGFGSKRMEVKLEKNQRLKSWNGPWGRSCFWREVWASKYYPMISHEKTRILKGNKNDLQNCGYGGENGLQQKTCEATTCRRWNNFASTFDLTRSYPTCVL